MLPSSSLRASALLLLSCGFLMPSLAEANDFSTQNYVLIPGDFNGDGRTDMFVQAKSPGNPEAVVLSDGSGGEPSILAQTWSEGYLGINWNAQVSKIYVADFNGDGCADLLVQSLASDNTQLVLQDKTDGSCSGFYSAPITLSAATTGQPYSWSAGIALLVVGDFNGDGKADVLMQPRATTGTVVLWSATGAGFTVTQHWAENYLGVHWSTAESVISAGDFNGDGKADLLLQGMPTSFVLAGTPQPMPVSDYGNNPTVVLLANSSGQFSAVNQTWGRYAFGNNNSVDWSPVTHQAVIGNFTGHSGSQQDVILQDRIGNGSTWLVTANSAGTFGTVGQTWTNGSSGLTWSATGSTLLAGDFNGDGVTDLFFQSQSSSQDNSIAYLTAGTGAVASTVVDDLGAAAPIGKVSNGSNNSNEVGMVPGKFSVDKSGSAIYTVAIQVPPGVHGMQPDLALTYNSHSGNGDLGVGWSIAGLSVITRCGQTLEDDGQWTTPSLSTSDRFCMDGQRLVPTPPHTSSNYWSSNGAYQYRTKIATFQQIVASGTQGNGPASFAVYDKTQMTRQYNGVTTGSDGQTTLTWTESSVTDPFGNVITYNYKQLPNNEYVLSEIDYGSANGNVGKVIFNYTTRPDDQYVIVATTGIATTQLLQSVQVYGPSGQLVRQYELGYQLSVRTSRELLQTLTECDATNNCVPPTTFTWPHANNHAGIWNGGVDTPSVITAYVDGSVRVGNTWKAADIDGDGLLDYVFLNPSTNTVHVLLGKDLSTDIDTGIAAGHGTLHLGNSAVADFYGSGQQELLVPAVTGTGSCADTPGYYMLLAWKNGRMTVDQNYKLIMPDGSAPNEYEGNIPVVVDVDGNGLPSLLTKVANCSGSNNGETLWLWHNNGSGWDAPVQKQNALFGNGDNAIVPINFTGKGYDEFFINHCTASVCYPSGVYRWGVAQKNMFVIGSDFTALDNAVPIFMDFNGDGLTDAAVPNYDTNVWCFYSNIGGAWSPTPKALPVPLLVMPSNCLYLDAEHADVATSLDYFGDGRQELMIPVPDASGVSHWYAVAVDPITGNPQTPLDTGIVWDGSDSVMFADANGDGQPDYIDPSGNDTSFSISYNNFTTPELIGEIQTSNNSSQSLGSTTVIHYLPWPLANAAGWSDPSAVPQLDSGASAPQYRPYAGALPLVVDYLVDSGLGSGNNTQWLYTYYLYGAAEMDTWGRGFLGFSQLESINENVGLLTKTVFSQGYLTAGMTLSSSQYSIPASELTPINTTISITTQLQCSWVKEDNNTTKRECFAGNASYTGFPGLTGLQLLSQTQNSTPTLLTLSKGGTFAYSNTSTTRSYDLTSGALYRTVVTSPTFVMDSSGNNAEATDVSVETTTPAGDDYKVDTVSTYNDNASTWCLGRVASSTVTDTWTPAGGTASKSPPHVASFKYAGCVTSEEDSAVLGPSGKQLSTLQKSYATDSTGTTLAADSFGNIIKTTITGINPDGSALPARVTTASYDVYGLYPVTSTNALGQSTTSTWDYRFGSQTSATDPNGLTVTTVYDSFGRKAKGQGIHPEQQTSWSYAWCGSGINCVDPNSVYAYTESVNSEMQPGTFIPATVTEYDRMGRVVFTTSYGLNGVPSYQATYYDVMSRAYLTSQPYQSGTVCWDYKTYDLLNRITDDYRAANDAECSSLVQNSSLGTPVIQPGATPPPYSYTDYAYSGLKTTVTRTPVNGLPNDPASEQTVTKLNALGKPASFKDANGKITTYSYDFWGYVSSVQDATGLNATSIVSDSAGDKLSMADPDMGTWAYSYDALGDLVTQQDPNETTRQQQPTTLKYDLLGRLVERDEPEGASTWKYDIAYGAGVGRLAYKTGPNGYWEGYAYDGYGDATDDITIANGQEYWVSTTHDAFGNVAQVVYPNLTALNVSGTNSPSGPTTGGLTLVMDTNNLQVDASWTNSANGAIYHLFRAVGANAAFSSAVEIYSGPDAGFDDTYPIDGADTYFVEACNGSQTSQCSTPVSAQITAKVAPTIAATPLVPADVNSTNVPLTLPPSQLPQGLTGAVTYRVLESMSGGTYVSGGSSSGLGVSTPITVSATVPEDGTYKFEIQACDHGGNVCSPPSAPSASYHTYIQPAAPTIINASATMASTIGSIIHWSAPSPVTGPVVYKVERSYEGGNWVVIATGVDATTYAVSYSDSGGHSFRVNACDADSTAVCGPFSGSAGANVPPAPTLSATLISGVQYQLSWSDTNAAVNTYAVYESIKVGSTGSNWGPYSLIYQGSATSMTRGLGFMPGKSWYVLACTASACYPGNSNFVSETQNLCGSSCNSSIAQPEPVMPRLREAPAPQLALVTRPQANHQPMSSTMRLGDLIQRATVNGAQERTQPLHAQASLALATAYAPMPHATRSVRVGHKSRHKGSGPIAVDPKLSAYPPLRHDKRLWAHYAAHGGIALGWLRRADCSNGTGCSEAAGSFALMVGYSYDQYGHAVSVTRLDENGRPEYNYWTAEQADARGHITQEGLQLDVANSAAAITVNRQYDQAMGVVTCINAVTGNGAGSCTQGMSGGNVIQSDSYAWDAYGNLINRSSAVTGLNETLGYDADNRLAGTSGSSGLHGIITQVNGVTVAQDTPTYQDTASNLTPGNIASRNGATYSYPSPGSPLPHAVSQMTIPGGVTRNFGYDADGNLTSESGDVTRTLTWYSYNKPNTITSGSVAESFYYGPDHDRYQRVDANPSDTVTTIYIDGLFEVQNDSQTGNTTYRNYIVAGGETIAVDVFQGGGAGSETISYFLHDHLGEVEATTDPTGQQVNQYSYDAWGKSRPTSGTSAFVTPGWGGCATTLPGQHEGFGGHENIDDECLVHMEGRMYDPETGRFLSADPTMQDPISTQGYDRYGYVQNNPLSGVDPSGYHFHDFAGPAEAILNAAGESTPCSYWCYGAAVALAAIDGYQQTGNFGDGLKSGGMEAAEAYAMYEIGQEFPNQYGPSDWQFWAKAGLEGTAGGAFDAADGGSFAEGFRSGAAASMAGNYIPAAGRQFWSTVRAVVAQYIVGGTASELGGGNFANGGATAAFVELFNYVEHDLRNNLEVVGSDKFKADVAAVEAAAKTAGLTIFDDLRGGDTHIVIVEGGEDGFGYNKDDPSDKNYYVKWNPSEAALVRVNPFSPLLRQSPALGLIHELGHGYQVSILHEDGHVKFSEDQEKYVVNGIETQWATAYHEPIRSPLFAHGGDEDYNVSLFQHDRYH